MKISLRDSFSGPAGSAVEKPKNLTIDEALEQVGFGKFNYFLILFTGVLAVNVVFESLGISFALPVLNCDLNLSNAEKGILGAVSFIGIIVSSPFWGFLADTIGRKRIMMPALLTNFGITVISSFSINFEMLAVTRFFGGIFLSASSATVFAYVGEFHCKKNRNIALLSAAVISASTATLFPFVAGVSINQTWEIDIPWLDFVYKPWRFCFVACGLLGFMCGIIICFLPESPKFLFSIGREKEALEVLKKIHRINNKNHKDYKEFHVTGLVADLDTPSRLPLKEDKQPLILIIVKSIWKQTAPLFMKPHLKNTLLASLIQFIIFYSAHGSYLWFPYILNSSLQYSRNFSEPARLCKMMEVMQSFNNQNFLNEDNEEVTQCSKTLETGTYVHSIALEFIYIGVLLVAAYATGKFDRRKVLFVSMFFCGVCGILSLVLHAQMVAIYMFILMLSCGVGITVVNSIVVDIYPTNLRGMAVCISLMLGRIGSVTGSYVLGLLIQRYCDAALYTFMTSLILAGVLGFLLPKTNHFSKDTTNKA